MSTQPSQDTPNISSTDGSSSDPSTSRTHKDTTSVPNHSHAPPPGHHPTGSSPPDPSLKPFIYKPNIFSRSLVWVFKKVNNHIPWHRLPSYIGTLNLAAYRIELRSQNLYDVYPSPDHQGKPGHPSLTSEDLDGNKFTVVRNSNGLFNDLERPLMGCAGMRFGRNVPREHTKRPSAEELMSPNPRLISNELMKRDAFKPATSLNMLAAAWIQFQVHDWFMHYNSSTEVHRIPVPSGDSWEGGKKEIEILKTREDGVLSEIDKEAPGYKNENTHWWDGSQIYGSSETRTRELRAGAVNGKLAVDTQGLVSFLPRDKNGVPETGFRDNWWLGLEILHTLFVLEHNAICDALHTAYPTWSSDKVFDTARLVNCALMAKIHTTEWTPAILAHPALQISMSANWWGLLGERLYKLLGRVAPGESISGIPGSGVEHHNAPYSLTEEFVSVYRMHSLLPDSMAFFDAKTGEHKKTYKIQDLAFEHARDPLLQSSNPDSTPPLSFSDIFYSFGINYPGAITLNNHSNFLRDLLTPEGHHIDLAALDILKDRERGIPRYNTFRRLFHLPPASSFLSLVTGSSSPPSNSNATSPPSPALTALAEKLERIYEGDIEKVDLLIGCLAEPLPQGFGFSDTAFRVFILMASRRLKSDRFIAGKDVWNERVYSKVGMEWVQSGGGSMAGVLGRHFPELAEGLKGIKNPFAPWKKIGKAGEYKGVETNA